MDILLCTSFTNSTLLKAVDLFKNVLKKQPKQKKTKKHKMAPHGSSPLKKFFIKVPSFLSCLGECCNVFPVDHPVEFSFWLNCSFKMIVTPDVQSHKIMFCDYSIGFKHLSTHSLLQGWIQPELYNYFLLFYLERRLRCKKGNVGSNDTGWQCLRCTN